MSTPPKVIGIGGIFFTSENPIALYKWYREVLGIESEAWGTQFNLNQNSSKDAYAVWSIMDQKGDYFKPSAKQFMINFVVNSVAGFEQSLKEKGVEVLGKEESDFGNFIWILDPDGNKIELWEPAK